MSVCCECCVLSGRGLCDKLITRPEESYRLWCVVVCDLETSRMRRPWPVLGRNTTGRGWGGDVDTRIWSWSVVGFWRKAVCRVWCVDVRVVSRMTIFLDIQTFSTLWGAGVLIKYSWQCVFFTKFSEILKKKNFNEYEKWVTQSVFCIELMLPSKLTNVTWKF